MTKVKKPAGAYLIATVAPPRRPASRLMLAKP